MPTRNNSALAIIGFLAAVACLVGLAYMLGARNQAGLKGAFELQMEETRLAAGIRAAFEASLDAEKGAVMADTDEVSLAFAQEAGKRAADLESAVDALGKLLNGRAAPEARLLGEFLECWARLRETDRRILGLAVQNTNLKAARLSHHQAMAALDTLGHALGEVKAAGRSLPAADNIREAADAVLLAALKVQAFHAPHIDEADGERMAVLEKAMAGQQALAAENLAALAALAPPAAAEALAEARQAAEEHARVTAEVVDLSRRNTNVESLALSLGQKRKLATDCSERLAALQQALAAPRLKATR